MIDWKSGISSGGDNLDITDQVHPDYKKLAERVATIVAGLYIVGVDILTKDFFQNAGKHNHIVVEANTRPGITGHHFPVYGQPRNLARQIAIYTLRKMGIDI